VSETTVPGDARRFVLRRGTAINWNFADDIRSGFAAVRKSIPPRWFYDDLGSALFDAICNLPEYYVTRAETEVLQRNAGEISAALGGPVRVAELGSGTARKTRILLDELTRGGRELEYVPVDIDANMLDKCGRDLVAEYRSLKVTAICSDFSRPSQAFGDALGAGGRSAVLFLGSTIGNLSRSEAVAMLRDLRHSLHAGDSFLLGVDLKKPKAILDPAYDDALGVTAAFNLNLLQRVNRELGGHFDLRSFAHRAFYDEIAGRIEMHLVSLREQSVRIDALEMEVAFTEGETIHTENSHKYDEHDLQSIAADSGFELTHVWTDSLGWFADALLTVV
jgi:dimethylhistidine N-methyltransferase